MIILLKVWDLETGKETYTLEGHKSFITAIATTPDGRYAISGSHDNTLKVWNLITGKEEDTLIGHISIISKIITINEDYIISGSWDHTIRIWDLKKSKQIHEGHTTYVTSIVITPDGRYAISGLL